ncbi:MAG: alpha-keto acid decarboxylase family protein [Planctomycetales bacterium]
MASRKDSRRTPAKAPPAGRRPTKPQEIPQTIGEYLIRRLQDYGIEHVFGIPGDFVLQFYALLEASPLTVVGCTREDNAGFAADAYARVHGMGAVCVTFSVGGLSMCNSIAGAYAEKSPVVVISGAPGVDEKRSDPLLHHRVRDFNTQREVFEKFTVASASLDDPLTAFREIDRCLAACARFKRPVYLEIPRDRVRSVCPHPYVPSEEKPVSNKHALREALEDAAQMINDCQRPVIVAGVEMHRFGLGDEVVRLAEKHQIPMVATLLGKSVVGEKHPLYLGVYEGAMCREPVRKFVEESDLLILLGTIMTDIDMGIYTARIDLGKSIYVTSDHLQLRHHRYHDVLLSDFVKGLLKAPLKPPRRPIPAACRREPVKFELQPDAPVTTKRLFERVNLLLREHMVVVADVGDCLFAASDLTIHRDTEFISPAYYTSMGFAIPASVGAQFGNRKLRPIVLVGDGAFQMTCLELSTAVRHEFNPIVLVLNNKGYGTERFLCEGPFNDILNWEYHRLPDLLGGGWGFEVHNEGDLDKALNAALANSDRFSLLNIHLEPTDISPALDRLAKTLSKRI